MVLVQKATADKIIRWSATNEGDLTQGMVFHYVHTAVIMAIDLGDFGNTFLLKFLLIRPCFLLGTKFPYSCPHSLTIPIMFNPSKSSVSANPKSFALTP